MVQEEETSYRDWSCTQRHGKDVMLASQTLLHLSPQGIVSPPLCLQAGAPETLRFVLGDHPEGQVLIPGGYQDENIPTSQISINLEVSGKPEICAWALS